MWFTMERIGRSHGVVDGSSSGPVLVVLVGPGPDCVVVLASPGLVDPGTWNREKEKK
jgi:hypothetical protein